MRGQSHFCASSPLVLVCHRDQLNRPLHGVERIRLGVRRELRGKPKQQLCRSTAGGNQSHTDFHESHVQFRVRLHAIRIEGELASATQRQPCNAR
jgi:hypothetical protein